MSLSRPLWHELYEHYQRVLAGKLHSVGIERTPSQVRRGISKLLLMNRRKPTMEAIYRVMCGALMHSAEWDSLRLDFKITLRGWKGFR